MMSSFRIPDRAVKTTLVTVPAIPVPHPNGGETFVVRVMDIAPAYTLPECRMPNCGHCARLK